MSASIAQIRAGLATNLGTIKDVQVSAYLLASPTPPSIHVLPTSIAYDEVMARGFDNLTFTVQAFVAFGLDQGAQVLLDLMLAPTGVKSVKTAIEADRTLGGTVQTLRVTDMTAYNIVTLGEGRQMLSADWTVEVLG